MWSNYFKVAIRNLIKFKGYAGINILGLAIGVACCIMIIQYLRDELSYDRHHEDHIYRVATEFQLGTRQEKTGTTPSPLVWQIKEDFPEVEKSARLFKVPGVSKFLIRYQDITFYEEEGIMADSTLFDLLTYDFVAGDRSHALDEPYTVVISEKMADKLFHQQNPIGKTLQIESLWGKDDYQITGVFRKDTYRSHINGEFYMSAMSGNVGKRFYHTNEWAGNNLFYTYIQLRPDADPRALEEKFPPWVDQYAGEGLRQMGFSKRHYLEAIEDIYLKTDTGFAIGPTGDITYIWLLGSVAIFILIIACINFMNLTTAKATMRAHEVGVRKVIGATRQTLMKQFLSEAFVYTMIAVIIAVAVVEIIFPYFNQLMEKELRLGIFSDPLFLPGLAVFVFLTTLLAGSYPSLYLSSFSPVSIFRGNVGERLSGNQIRKGLVVLQFIISIALIQGALVINEQMEYTKNKNLGFNSEHKVIIPFNSPSASEHVSTLQNELLKDSRVLSAGGTSAYPGLSHINDILVFGEGQTPDESNHAYQISVDPEYIDLMEFELLEGRSFSRDRLADTLNSIVINETLMRGLGYNPENVVGKQMFYEWQGQRHEHNIIGVLKDFHFASLHSEIDGQIFRFDRSNGINFLIATISGQDLSGTLASIEKSWNQINPEEPFEYHFLDDKIQQNYQAELRMGGLIRWGTILAIFVSCLGLLGLATFAAERRMKEISVRKILGASPQHIVRLLSMEFMVLIIIALLIATPVAWYAMDKWLQNFYYHIDMPVWTYLVAGIAALGIALLTITWQTLRAASANPVQALRSE